MLRSDLTTHPRRVRAILVPALVTCAAIGLYVEADLQTRLHAAQTARPSTWSATASGGRTFMGTWTHTVDSATGAVSGNWTLIDAQGRTLARGGWSAVKSPTGWTGAWRATSAASSGEYAGTWRASSTLKANAPFADLFQAALEAVVSGTWQAGPQSGAWSIRAN